MNYKKQIAILLYPMVLVWQDDWSFGVDSVSLFILTQMGKDLFFLVKSWMENLLCSYLAFFSEMPCAPIGDGTQY